MPFRRFAYGLISILAAGSLMTACGGGGQTAAGSSGSASGSTKAAAAFYKGKTIKFIVPYSAGGGFDTIARTLAPFLAKYSGAKVVVVNKPGAGGIVGINDMVAAIPNGLTLVEANGPGIAASQIAKGGGAKLAKGMNFDITKLPWVGRLTGHVPLAYTGPNGKLKSFKGLVGSTGLKFGGTGPGGALQINAFELEYAFNAKFDIINGYKGTANLEAAVIRHDVDVSMASSDGASRKVAAGTIAPLFVMANKPYPYMPKVPTLAQLKGVISAKGYAVLEEASTVFDATGRSIATTPGTPANRVSFLTAALKKAVDDPAFVAQAKKVHALPSYLSGSKVLALFKKAAHPSAEMKALILKAYA